MGIPKKTVDDMMKHNWQEALRISHDEGGKNIKEHLHTATKESGLHKTTYIFYAPELLSHDTGIFVDAWINFCEELVSGTCEQ